MRKQQLTNEENTAAHDLLSGMRSVITDAVPRRGSQLLNVCGA